MNISDHEGVQWLLQQLGLTLRPDRFTAKYNVAPTSALWGVAISRHALTLEPMQWGYIPPWAKDGQFRQPLFNARAETIWEKPSFKNQIRRYRGIVPANGFYEWARKGKQREAKYISLKDAPAMALGAIIQTHTDGYMQCCLITTESNAEMQSVHHRQPVVIQPDDMEAWLTDDTPALVNRCMEPIGDGKFQIRGISGYVNNAQNDGPKCLT